MNDARYHRVHRSTLDHHCELTTVSRHDFPTLSGRTLHVIDIENLAGTGFCMSEQLIAHVVDRYRTTAHWTNGDLTSIAVNTGLLSAVAFATRDWSQKSLHGAKGKDGADLVLLQHTNQAKLLAGVDRVVIGSGDGIFSKIIDTARTVGTATWVVAAPNATSHQLRYSADRYVPFHITSAARPQCPQQPIAHSTTQTNSTPIYQPTHQPILI